MKKYFIYTLTLCLALSVRFAVIGQNIQEERIFVHLQKNLAVVGETLWFTLKLYNPNGEPYSKIAYAELIDRDLKAVYQTIFSVENGLLEGNMNIPKQLVSDHYLLRFYTRTSPFLGNHGIDNQLITIINPQKPNPNQFPLKSTDPIFPIQKAELNEALIAEKSIPKKRSISIDLKDFEGIKLQVSAAIQNPFLPEIFQGRMNGHIYQPFSEKAHWIPEPYGHVVYGKNLDAMVDTTETFFLSAHGGQSVLNTAKPKSNGDLYFDLGPLKSYDYFIIQSSNWEDQLNFSIQSPFWDLKFKEEFAFPAFQLGEKDKPLLMDLILSAQVNPYFYATEKTPFRPIVTGFVADKTYFLDDYNRFEKTETVLREYVPEVAVRKQHKKTLFKLLNNPIGSIFDQNPLLLVDAMPIFDTDLLADFDPKNIQKLEVLAREFYLNEDKFAGVLSFSSYDNDFGGFPLPTTALYLNYPDIQIPKILQSPHFNPQLSDSKYPDFRTGLFWSKNNPEGQTSLQIFSSLVTGNFELLVSFINENGEYSIVKDIFQVID